MSEVSRSGGGGEEPVLLERLASIEQAALWQEEEAAFSEIMDGCVRRGMPLEEAGGRIAVLSKPLGTRCLPEEIPKPAQDASDDNPAKEEDGPVWVSIAAPPPEPAVPVVGPPLWERFAPVRERKKKGAERGGAGRAAARAKKPGSGRGRAFLLFAALAAVAAYVFWGGKSCANLDRFSRPAAEKNATVPEQGAWRGKAVTGDER